MPNFFRQVSDFAKRPQIGKRVFGQNSSFGQALDSAGTQVARQAVPVVVGSVTSAVVTSATMNPAAGTVAGMMAQEAVTHRP